MATIKETAAAGILVVVACCATGGVVYKVTADINSQYTNLDQKITTNQIALIEKLAPLSERIAVIETKIQKVSDSCSPLRPDAAPFYPNNR